MEQCPTGFLDESEDRDDHRVTLSECVCMKCDAVGLDGQAAHRPRRNGEIGRLAKTFGKIVSLSRCSGG